MWVWSPYTHLSTAKKFLVSFFFFQLVHKWREAQIGVKIFKLIFPSLINPLRSFVLFSCHANFDRIRVSPPSRGQKPYVWVQALHYGLILFKKKKIIVRVCHLQSVSIFLVLNHRFSFLIYAYTR